VFCPTAYQPCGSSLFWLVAKLENYFGVPVKSLGQNYRFRLTPPKARGGRPKAKINHNRPLTPKKSMVNQINPEKKYG
jgi:hypothetical protein